MGRMVFLLDEETGMKVSVGVGPDGGTVQLACVRELNELTASKAAAVADALIRAADRARCQIWDEG